MRSTEVCTNPDAIAEVRMMSSKLSLRLMSMAVMVTVVVCLVGVEGVQAEEDWGHLRRMRIGDGSDWWFLGEPWSDGRGPGALSAAIRGGDTYNQHQH